MADPDMFALIAEAERLIDTLDGHHTKRDIAGIALSIAKPYGIDEILVPYMAKANAITAISPGRTTAV